MRQQSLASQGSFEKYGRKSRRELFLDEMNQVVPWAELEALVEPRYPKADSGRRPVGLAIMLQVYFVQQWFNLSDPGVEEALYESAGAAAFRWRGSGGCAGTGRDDHLPLPSFAGEARVGRADAGCGEPSSGPQGHPYRDRHDRRCDDYPRSFVDEEPERQTRPGDASDSQGPTVVLRPEGAHRGGQQGRSE